MRAPGDPGRPAWHEAAAAPARSKRGLSRSHATVRSRPSSFAEGDLPCRTFRSTSSATWPWRCSPARHSTPSCRVLPAFSTRLRRSSSVVFTLQQCSPRRFARCLQALELDRCPQQERMIVELVQAEAGLQHPLRPDMRRTALQRMRRIAKRPGIGSRHRVAHLAQ